MQQWNSFQAGKLASTNYSFHAYLVSIMYQVLSDIKWTKWEKKVSDFMSICTRQEKKSMKNNYYKTMWWSLESRLVWSTLVKPFNWPSGQEDAHLSDWLNKLWRDLCWAITKQTLWKPPLHLPSRGHHPNSSWCAIKVASHLSPDCFSVKEKQSHCFKHPETRVSPQNSDD